MGNPVKALAPSSKFELVLLEGSEKGKRYTLDQSVFSVGRGENNSLTLGEDNSVSRNHIEIKNESSGLVIYNVSGKNFVLVNGKKVERASLKKGDKIQIGSTQFQIEESLNSLSSQSPLNPVNPLQVVSSVSPAQQSYYPQNAHPMSPHVSQSMGVVNPMGGMPAPSSVMSSGGASTGRSQRRRTTGKGGLKPFHFILIAVVAIAIYLMSPSKSKNKKSDEITSSSQIQEDIRISEEEVNKYKEKMEKLKSPEAQTAYLSAQEYFTRAMREFYNGQYGRAITAFQVVLNNDQNNAQARYYYDLARRKFDQQIKDHLKQGLEYKEKKSWNKCQSQFGIVMVLLQNQMSDPRYKQAKSYFDECNLAMGRGF